MIWSHLNLSRRSNDADKLIEHLKNEYWKFCAAYHARNKKIKRYLYDIIVLNVIY